MQLKVPVIEQVDVLIVGGSTTAVTLARELRQSFRSVFLATPYSYLGEDCYGRIAPAVEESSYAPAVGKALLERKLIQSGTVLRYLMTPLRPMVDASRNLGGWLFFTPGGYVAVAARVVVDATPEGFLPYQCRLARRGGTESARQVALAMLGGCRQEVEAGAQVAISTVVSPSGKKPLPISRYSREFIFRENQISELHRLEGQLRQECWSSSCVSQAELCDFEVNRRGWEQFESGEKLPLFRAGMVTCARLLGLTGAVPPRQNSWYVPSRNVSHRGAEECAASSGGLQVVWQEKKKAPVESPLAPFELGSIPDDPMEYQVVVIGGGVAGAAAAIAAARGGARVLLAAEFSQLGGDCEEGVAATASLQGFAAEVQQGTLLSGDGVPTWKDELIRSRRSAWLLEQSLAAGVSMRFRTVMCGVMVNDRQVRGVVLADDHGEVTVVHCQCVVDATPNGAVATAAGAGVISRVLEEPFTGNCLCDGGDLTDELVAAHQRAQRDGAFDCPVMPVAVASVGVTGDVVIQPTDILLERRWADVVATARGSFEVGGLHTHPLFMLHPVEAKVLQAQIPLRALLPLNLDGVILCGGGISVHSDAMPVFMGGSARQNLGYAAGVAAALAVMDGRSLRRLEWASLQQQLLRQGIISPEDVGEASTPFPPPITAGYNRQQRLAVHLSRPDQSRRQIKAHFLRRPDVDTAQLLAFFGDASGREELQQALSDALWEDDVPQPAKGADSATGVSFSQVGGLIFALRAIGGAGSGVVRLLRQLGKDSPLSHLRAVAMFLLRWPDAAAVPLLEAILKGPGFARHANMDLQWSLTAGEKSDSAIAAEAISQLKELYVSAALYACKPGHPAAKEALLAYRNGRQARYAAFAAKILD